ncbi:MAG: radical SAM protein [Elusimicrobiota bacterium]
MYLPDSFYEGTVIRPPSEADSLIFQVTLGCTDNSCIFCPAYKDKKFKIKEISDIEREMKYAAGMFPGTRKIFLADGDAIAVGQEKLVKILELAEKYFPGLTRAGIYGSIKSLENKSVEDLKELKALKLGIIYLGFETGDPDVYKFIGKYGSPQGNIDACEKVKEAGIRTNVTVISGLGGKDMSRAHAENTAKMLNRAQPDQIAALTLMIVPGTKLHAMKEKGEFKPLDDFEFLAELKILIENLEDFRCQFFANHASNYYPIAARFPKDKPAVIAELTRLLNAGDKSGLRPEWTRGL